MATVYKIHPAIGIARLGNSDQFYIAPEEAGALPTDPKSHQPVTSFRDSRGRLLKQAARFRVFAYESADDPGTEVRSGSGGVKAVQWTVHLANKKASWYQFEQLTGSGMEGDAGYIANGPKINPLRNPRITNPAQRQALILDPGPRTVGGSFPALQKLGLPPGLTTDAAKIKPHAIQTLGALQLDAQGNLLVLGGDGNSGTTNLKPSDGTQPPSYEYALTTYANNDGWFDDTSDGPVTATLLLDDGSTVPVDSGAWCLCAPPAYAPQILNQVTLYDTMFDVAVRELGARPDLYSNGQFNAAYEVDYALEVAPILARPAFYQWVAILPSAGILAHAGITQDQSDPSLFPLSRLRTQETLNTGMLMPFLAGDNPLTDSTISKYLALTRTQYFLISQWWNGKVRQPGGLPLPSPGQAIDQGVLENCVGGAFCPGIEMTWISRNPTIYEEPFRLRHAVVQGPLSTTYGNDNDYSQGMQPGDATKYMAQPWQADFNQCSNQRISKDPRSNDVGEHTATTTYWWWPAQRPFDVYPQQIIPASASAGAPVQVQWTRGFLPDPKTATLNAPNLGDMQMVENWKDLGFIVQTAAPAGSPQYVEVGRLTALINAYRPPALPPIQADSEAPAARPAEQGQ